MSTASLSAIMIMNPTIPRLSNGRLRPTLRSWLEIEWVHPFKDVGFQSAENREYFEKGIVPQSGIFTHPDKNVAYEPYKAKTKQKEDEAEA